MYDVYSIAPGFTKLAVVITPIDEFKRFLRPVLLTVITTIILDTNHGPGVRGARRHAGPVPRGLQSQSARNLRAPHSQARVCECDDVLRNGLSSWRNRFNPGSTR